MSLSVDPPAESSDGPYQSYGRFDPLDAKHILERFEKQEVRFQIADASGLFPSGSVFYYPPIRIIRGNYIEIFVHRDDSQKAQKIISEV
jgi:hypothetical protein